MTVTYDALRLEAGKKQNLAYVLAKEPKKIVIFHLVRTREEETAYMNGFYAMCESLKNEALMTGKYHSV